MEILDFEKIMGLLNNKKAVEKMNLIHLNRNNWKEVATEEQLKEIDELYEDCVKVKFNLKYECFLCNKIMTEKETNFYSNMRYYDYIKDGKFPKAFVKAYCNDCQVAPYYGETDSTRVRKEDIIF